MKNTRDLTHLQVGNAASRARAGLCIGVAAMAMAGCGQQATPAGAQQPLGVPVANGYQQAQPMNGAYPAPGQPGAQGYGLQPAQNGQAVPPAPVAYQNAPPAYAPQPGYASQPGYAQQPGYATAPAYAPNDGSPPNYAPPTAYAQAPAPAVIPQAVRAAPRTAPVHQSAPVASNHIGRISSIEPIRERPQGSGAGGVLGGVLGAVVGHQFGGGNGRTAMTVLGGVGGAVAGNNVERNIHERVVGYRVHVRLDDGDERSYQESSVGDLQVGDRVRVDGQRLRHL